MRGDGGVKLRRRKEREDKVWMKMRVEQRAARVEYEQHSAPPLGIIIPRGYLFDLSHKNEAVSWRLKDTN